MGAFPSLSKALLSFLLLSAPTPLYSSLSGFGGAGADHPAHEPEAPPAEWCAFCYGTCKLLVALVLVGRVVS